MVSLIPSFVLYQLKSSFHMELGIPGMPLYLHRCTIAFRLINVFVTHQVDAKQASLCASPEPVATIGENAATTSPTAKIGRMKSAAFSANRMKLHAFLVAVVVSILLLTDATGRKFNNKNVLEILTRSIFFLRSLSQFSLVFFRRYFDCMKGEDEISCNSLCPNKLNCKSGKGCYLPVQRCNSIANCADSSDERNCCEILFYSTLYFWVVSGQHMIPATRIFIFFSVSSKMCTRGPICFHIKAVSLHILKSDNPILN